MSHTHKHEWKYRSKQYWLNYGPLIIREKKLIPPSDTTCDLMNRLAGDYVEIEYRLPRPEQGSPDPYPYHHCEIDDDRKKEVKQMLWRRHRRSWKQALRQRDWDKLVKLPRRPGRYAWILW